MVLFTYLNEGFFHVSKCMLGSQISLVRKKKEAKKKKTAKKSAWQEN